MSQTNNWGFPTVQCAKCAGTGRHDWTPSTGNICRNCGGKGTLVADYAIKIWLEFVDHVEAQRGPSISKCSAGDVVRVFGNKVPFKTIAQIETGVGEATQWTNGVETGWRTNVTFTDGTTQQFCDNIKMRRKFTADPAPYLAQIQYPLDAEGANK